MKDFRPIYHFTPLKNWMNDPNGPIYYVGEYHLFYQYNPLGIHHGNINWGHAKSADLVNWVHLPVALVPDKSLGEDQCFSGCTVLINGRPTLFYTSIGPDRIPETGAQQWRAASEDGMLTWRRTEGNPVLTVRDNGGNNILDWRDPYVWGDGGKWFMVLGGRLENHGCVSLYSSADSEAWRFEKILFVSQKSGICECPNFFRLGDRHILFYSPSASPLYHIGSFENMQFTPEYDGCIDFSGFSGFYAPTSFVDGRGRRIMLGWMTEGNRPKQEKEYDYTGAQSIPRELSLDADGLLLMKPVDELKCLRAESEKACDIVLQNDTYESGLYGDSVEIRATIQYEDGVEQLGLNVFRNPSGGEVTRIQVDIPGNALSIDRSGSSVSKDTDKGVLSGAIRGNGKNAVELHVFLDKSIIEVFLDYKTCMSTRVYPLLDGSDRISLFSKGSGRAYIKDLEIYSLKK